MIEDARTGQGLVWPPVPTEPAPVATKTVAELEDRIRELEAQNDLLRAVAIAAEEVDRRCHEDAAADDWARAVSELSEPLRAWSRWEPKPIGFYGG